MGVEEGISVKLVLEGHGVRCGLGLLLELSSNVLRHVDNRHYVCAGVFPSVILECSARWLSVVEVRRVENVLACSGCQITNNS